jgi:hypothetical protein
MAFISNECMIRILDYLLIFYFAEQLSTNKKIFKRKRSFILNKARSGAGVDLKFKLKSASITSNPEREESDDSIGSASDLRARQDHEDQDEKEDSETMTVNDSVMTCGSSAYHAECESMATRDELPSSRRYPGMTKVPEAKELDSLFVGHAYADKPLLADDELDKGDTVSPAPLIDMDDEVRKEDNRTHEGDANDVFSMAPFKSKRKSDIKEFIDASHSELLITMSPNVAEGSLVDLGEEKPTSNTYLANSKAVSSNESFCLDTATDKNPFSANYKSRASTGSTPQNENIMKSEDLFGSVPFDPMAVRSVSTNSFCSSSEAKDFIHFGANKQDAVLFRGVIRASDSTIHSVTKGDYGCSVGISNMSFEDHPPSTPNSNEFVELSFPEMKQTNTQIFFQPSKSKNPFS